MHQERNNKHKNEADVKEGAVPAYLLDREGVSRAKVLSNMVKQKRKEKGGKWNVPLPKVRAMSEDEIFKVVRSGKRKCKWSISLLSQELEANGYEANICWRGFHP